MEPLSEEQAQQPTDQAQQTTNQAPREKMPYYPGLSLHSLTESGDFYLVQLSKLLMFITEDEEALKVVLVNPLTRKLVAVRTFGEISVDSEIFVAKTQKHDTVAISHRYDTYILTSAYQSLEEPIMTDGAVTSSLFVSQDGEDVLYLGVLASLVIHKKEDGRYIEDASIEIGNEETDLINNLVYNREQKVIAVGMVANSRLEPGKGKSKIVIWYPESQQTLYSFEMEKRLLIELAYIPTQEEILYSWEEDSEGVGMLGLSVLTQVQDEFDSQDLTDESLGELKFLSSKDQLWINNDNIFEQSCHLSRVKHSADRSIDRYMTVKDNVLGISEHHGFVVTQHRKRQSYYMLPISHLERSGLAKRKTIQLGEITDYTSFN